MTIAACYVSSEGVVFGADSTVTVTGPGRSMRHYDHAQKIFQIGEESGLGVAFWGLAALPNTSHRTMVARLSDTLRDAHPVNSVAAAAVGWRDLFWSEYSSQLAPVRQQAAALAGLLLPTDPERAELNSLLQRFTVGFCLGGCLPPTRDPAAFELLFDPTLTAPPQPRPLAVGVPGFWGQPNLIGRLVYGIDPRLFAAIGGSPHWQGTQDQLLELVRAYNLSTVHDLPIREAIDWVFTAIYATNQAFKFSNLPPVCGGPVEIAVITTDRSFRWVRHKRLGAALGANGNTDGA